MPKNKIVSIESGREALVDSKAIAKEFNCTRQYINRLAREKKIPSYGLQNGAKVYRRFDPAEVRAAMHQGVTDATA